MRAALLLACLLAGVSAATAAAPNRLPPLSGTTASDPAPPPAVLVEAEPALWSPPLGERRVERGTAELEVKDGGGCCEEDAGPGEPFI